MTMNDLRSRFGLHVTPFTREIQIENRFCLDFYEHALHALLNTVEQRMSAVLSAPAGAGKTVLLRALHQSLPEARYRISYIKVCGLSKREFCRELTQAVGCPSAGTYPVLIRHLQEHFEQSSANDGLRPVLLIDEAHDLKSEVIGILRLLTNFDMDSRLVVSIVLAGQPRLYEQFKRPELEDVARRMSHYVMLRTLSREETFRYIQHRCLVAGAKNEPFDKKSLDAVYEIGRGNLRATDNLALKALEMAHLADCDVVSVNHVMEARSRLWP
jgi:general secretion pathway protein A